MAEFKYAVTVECETKNEADTVIGERLGHDEDYGFDYTVDFKDGPPVLDSRERQVERLKALIDELGGITITACYGESERVGSGDVHINEEGEVLIQTDIMTG